MAFFKLLRQSPLSARIGLAMILINVFAAIFTPYLSPYSETEVVGDVWLPMSKDHLLGTDHIGRDLFTRLLYGARNTIAIAFITTMLSFVVGIICGFFAATLAGKLVLSYIIVFISHYIGLSFIEPFLENVDDATPVYIGILIFAAAMTGVIILVLKLDWQRIMVKFAPWTLDENSDDNADDDDDKNIKE